MTWNEGSFGNYAEIFSLPLLQSLKDYTSGSQPFLARGTLIWYKMFGGTPKSRIRPKY
jgi:hypothetical protein